MQPVCRVCVTVRKNDLFPETFSVNPKIILKTHRLTKTLASLSFASENLILIGLFLLLRLTVVKGGFNLNLNEI